MIDLSFLTWIQNNFGLYAALGILALGALLCALVWLLWKTRAFWWKGSWLQKCGRRILQKKLPQAKQFSVGVTHLEGDSQDEAVRQNILESLRSKLPFDCSKFDRVTQLSGEGNLQVQEQQGHEQARQWLKKSKHDLVIWGQVLPPLAGKERRVRLHFTANDSGVQKSQAFNESAALEFPVADKAPLEAMIRSQVLTRMAGFSDSHPIADALKDEVDRIEPMAKKWPPGETRAALHLALGNAWTLIGEQKGDASALQKAVATYGEALKEYTQKRYPLDWAMTQNNLGNALRILGESSSGTQQLEAAIVAYRKGLKEDMQEHAPLDWEVTQNNLGNALRSSGEGDLGMQQLEAAVAAYREALKEYTQERMPFQWAMAQNNLGAALIGLGERKSDLQQLEAAIVAFHEALKEYTRNRAPLGWAMVQNNLGTALAKFGGLNYDMQMLKDAVVAYREALKEYTRDVVPLDWALTQNNLGNVLCLLGRRNSNTQQLEAAIAAFREAFKEHTQERMPFQWAGAQNNLGYALEALGQLDLSSKGLQYLQEAEVAYQDALSVFEAAQASHHVEVAENNLARVQALIAQR